MKVRLAIGDFSRMTHLSVKALRHYHDVGTRGWTRHSGNWMRRCQPRPSRAAGPRAALYSAAFFELDDGEVVVYIPVTDDLGSTGRARMLEIPAAELAVAAHKGSLADLDQTYGALGTYVAKREIGVDGPIREHYLVDAHEPGFPQQGLAERPPARGTPREISWRRRHHRQRNWRPRPRRPRRRPRWRNISSG